MNAPPYLSVVGACCYGKGFWAAVEGERDDPPYVESSRTASAIHAWRLGYAAGRPFKAPQHTYPFWNRAMRGAFKKGMIAALEGNKRVSPYDDKRKYDGRLTWSRAFEICWFDGYDHVIQKRSPS